MPITYRIDRSARQLFVVIAGTVTQAERMSAMRSWLADADYEPGFNTLADFSASTNAPTLPELREIASFISQNAVAVGRKKLAIVAPAPITFGVARQFQVLAEPGPITVRVFADRAAAEEWLAVDSAEAVRHS